VWGFKVEKSFKVPKTKGRSGNKRKEKQSSSPAAKATANNLHQAPKPYSNTATQQPYKLGIKKKIEENDDI
jgi:hypothetical protein